jgi:zinc/manganese transport system substrate-binding protein
MSARRRLPNLLVAVSAATMVAACAAESPSSPAADGALRVVATTTQVGSVAREIGGEAIELTVLLKPGIEAHDFELTPAAGAALEEADLILVSGAGIEDWLDETLDTIGGADRVRDLSEGVSLRYLGEDELGHEDEGAVGEVDPHYWLSAPNAIVMTENARAALADAAPNGADGFTERAAALVARLERADAEVRAIVGEIPAGDRRIVTDHDALGYFIDEYGLEFVGSVFPSLDVSSEPSAQQIEALVAEIRDQGVTAIFTESSVNPRLAAAVADETEARLVDEPIYTDSLGPDGSGADTLDGMLLHNARVIRDGLLGG